MMCVLDKLPLDYSLCTGTVTVYHREGLTCEVLEGVHYEWTEHRRVDAGVETRGGSFLLVIPYRCDIRPGDRVEGHPVTQVAMRTLGDRFCHMEVRG
jgi:hypothetical protein